VKVVTSILLLAGMAVLAVVLYQADLPAVWSHLRHVGWLGVAAVFALYAVTFGAEIVAWNLTLPSARLTPEWIARLWTAQMVGDAVNNLTPLASVGGEPVKVALLKNRYGVSYRESTASLVLMQTIVNGALVFFVSIGFVLMWMTDALPPAYRLAAGSGLATLTAGLASFFFVQRYQGVSRVSGWLGRHRFGARALALLDVVRDIEDRLIAFYTGQPGRFATAIALVFVNWVLGSVEIACMLYFLGHPISLADAWVIESLFALVRTALFVVPANIGTQEGSLVLVCGLITGSPTLGLAVALIRRFRELTWLCGGVILGWFVSRRPAAVGVSVVNVDAKPTAGR
jgi:uncharacterized protein (TIRG00374 family)